MIFPNFSEIEKFRLSYVHTGSQLKDLVYERSRRLFTQGDAQRDAISTLADLQKRQQEVREFVINSVGGLPPSDTPLNARVTRTTRGDGFTVEAVIYESRPKHYVTASLYLPDERPERCPAVIFVCGHSAFGRLAERYQSVCQTLAKAGLIVLAQDPVGQGERSSYYDAERNDFRIPRAVSDHDYVGTQCQWIGDSIARYFIHDTMRSVDYLQSRPEVDPERIGITGNSGGGTQTSLLMMTEPRFVAAAPGTFIMNRETYQRTGQSQDAEQIWNGFTAAGYDHEDILLAMAPKPVCVLTVKSDFFPIEGARRSVERARRVWAELGCKDRLEMVEDADVHGYTQPLAEASARFFAKHLLGREVAPEKFSIAPFAEAELYATKKGQVAGEFADAEFVFDANLVRLREIEARRTALPADQRRERAVDWIRKKVFANRESCELNPRLILRRQIFRNLDVDVAFWATQPALTNLGFLFRPAGKALRGVTIALWDGGSSSVSSHSAWLLRECGKDRAVLLLNLCGMGPLNPDPINLGAVREFYGTFHKLADDLTWIGDNLAALRIFEVTKALDVLSLWPEIDLNDVRLYGHGRAGYYGKLAAAIDPRIKECDWQEPFTIKELAASRYYDTYDIKSLLIPGALNYFDLDEI